MGLEKQGLVWRRLMIEEPNIIFCNKTLRQFFTYASIGLLTNFLGYIIYIILTYLWAPQS